ncbi:MAG: hypothetical protein ACOC2N_06445 [Spirochaetota bacterium]
MKAKIARCKYCGGWTIVSALPHGDVDDEALEDFRRKVLEGDTIDYIDNADLQNGKERPCRCKPAGSGQQSLFAEGARA